MLSYCYLYLWLGGAVLMGVGLGISIGAALVVRKNISFDRLLHICITNIIIGFLMGYYAIKKLGL